MKSNHTPGPWVARPLWIDGHLTKQQARFRCNITSGEHCPAISAGVTPEEASANAILIAAAPELLDALRQLAEIGEGGVIERRETGKPAWNALDAVKSIARTAIAKAERRTE